MMNLIHRQSEINRTVADLGSVPTARTYSGVAFTIGSGEDDEDSHRLRSLALNFGSDITAESSTVGWGGSGFGVTFILESLATVGGVGGGTVIVWSSARRVADRVVQVLRRLRGDGQRPDMSVGAVGYLCIADLATRLDSMPEEIQVVHAGELMPGLGGCLGHSGTGELFVYLLATGDDSWLYLGNSQGDLLHRSEGGPLPATIYWPTGADWTDEPKTRESLAEGYEPDAVGEAAAGDDETTG